MRAASQIPGRSPLMWMMLLHLHVNLNADDDDDDDDDILFSIQTLSVPQLNN